MSNTAQADSLLTLLHNHPELETQRNVVVGLRRRYEPFADRNFDTELALNFGARFWEMCLGCALLDRGFELSPRFTSAGPDLCVLSGGRRIWIEATAPTQGTGADAVRGLEDGGWVPEQEIVLRYRSAVEDKHRKWQGYVASGIIDPNEPFIIAVNGFQIPHLSAFSDEIPYPIRAVLPLGPSTVTVDVESGAVVDEGFQTRWRIGKKSGAQISTAVFLEDAYAGISGLLFSNTHPLRVWKRNVSVLSYLHNPRSVGVKALPRAWLRAGTEYWVEGNKLGRQVLQDGS